MEAIGWLGSLLLAACALPQAVAVFRGNKIVMRMSSFSWTFLIMWFVGDLCLLVYTLKVNSVPLTLNYGLNAALISYLIAVKWNERHFVAKVLELKRRRRGNY